MGEIGGGGGLARPGEGGVALGGGGGLACGVVGEGLGGAGRRRDGGIGETYQPTGGIEAVVRVGGKSLVHCHLYSSGGHEVTSITTNLEVYSPNRILANLAQMMIIKFQNGFKHSIRKNHCKFTMVTKATKTVFDCKEPFRVTVTHVRSARDACYTAFRGGNVT